MECFPVVNRHLCVDTSDASEEKCQNTTGIQLCGMRRQKRVRKKWRGFSATKKKFFFFFLLQIKLRFWEKNLKNKSRNAKPKIWQKKKSAINNSRKRKIGNRKILKNANNNDSIFSLITSDLLALILEHIFSFVILSICWLTTSSISVMSNL